MMRKEEIIRSLEKEIELVEEEYTRVVDSLKNTIEVLRSGVTSQNPKLRSSVEKTGKKRGRKKKELSDYPSVPQALISGKPAKKEPRKKETNANLVFSVIERAGKLISNAEITDVLMSLNKINSSDRQKAMALISNTLSILKKNNKIISYKTGKARKDTYWGLQDWLDDKGNVKSQFSF